VFPCLILTIFFVLVVSPLVVVSRAKSALQIAKQTSTTLENVKVSVDEYQRQAQITNIQQDPPVQQYTPKPTPNSRPKSSAIDSFEHIHKATQPTDILSQPQNVASNQSILIGLTTSKNSTLLPHILRTWGSTLNESESLYIYIGDGRTRPEILSENITFMREISESVKPVLISNTFTRQTLNNTKNMFLVKLPFINEPEFPPVYKNVAQWEHMAAQHDRFKWFGRCDDDTYVNMPKLRTFLSGFDSSQKVYFGFLNKKVRSYEAEIIQLPSPFAEGMCQFWSRGTCEAVGKCRESVMHWMEKMGKEYTHTDVEFSRCLYSQGIVLKDTMNRILRNSASPLAHNKTQAMPAAGDSRLFAGNVSNLAVIHPVKLPHQMEFLHHIITGHLPSPLANITETLSPLSILEDFD